MHAKGHRVRRSGSTHTLPDDVFKGNGSLLIAKLLLT